jgi:uncharacterized membrane protein
MFCSKCGAKNEDNATFCAVCGAQLSSTPNQGTGAPQSSGSQTGLQKNVAGLLCYLFGWVTGIIFLLIEKDRFVRFHAIQSTIISVAVIVVQIFLGILMSILWRLILVLTVLNSIIWIGWVVLSIFLMVKAYQNQCFKVPFAGPIAEKYANK